MRAALTALTDELKRLKSTGVTSVPVSEESIAALRKIVASRSAGPAAKNAGPVSVRDREGSPSAVQPALTAAKTVAPARSLPVEAKLVPKPDAAPALPPPPVIVLPAGDKPTRWAALRDLVVNHPVCVANVRAGKKVVLGVGSLDAKIMFIDEAPGMEEEARGEPFVGPAGQLLTKMIGAMGVKREDVFIANIMTWRPQVPTPAGTEQVGSRDATAEELAFCRPFIQAQIELVNPDLIVVTGATAAKGLLGPGAFKNLTDVRGQWREFAGKPVIVTYHPGYLLRQESVGPVAARKAKRATWEDLLKVMERAGLTITDKQRGFFLEK